MASVLSGNRNFEARIHQRIKSNFLASPMLVVAFALAGHIDVDLSYEPVGLDPNGDPVYLEDIWPSNEDIEALVAQHLKKEFFEIEYGRIYDNGLGELNGRWFYVTFPVRPTAPLERAPPDSAMVGVIREELPRVIPWPANALPMSC